MTALELQAYLYEHIPLSQAMQAEVLEVAPAVVLAAPLEPNINHRGTGFGGSIATLATLAAWSAVRRIVPDGTTLVIAREEVDFVSPVTGAFAARCSLDDGAADVFLSGLERRGKARMTVSAAVYSEGELVARFEGQFVAIAHAP